MKLTSNFARVVTLLSLAGTLAWFAGCRDVVPSASGPREATSAAAAAKAPGYLLPEERPDSVALLPPPPAPGSPEFVADEDVYRKLSPLQDTARWQLAARDANLKFPEAANVFSCAVGIDVAAMTTPRLYVLLQRVVIDAGQSTAKAKQKYNSNRPFEVTGDPTCVPEDEQLLRGNASYPSGHASLGHAWGEVFAELRPERAAAARARGYEFGQSRVICRVHRQSDVDAGRTIGQAVFERLHQDPEFVADMAAAKLEVKKARRHGPSAGRDCRAEAAALQVTDPAQSQRQ
ncbi:MAG: phosphatase PAP2 family protein [Proteobacteria bacterium]|nr:phosphatase PAP2 family protein [Pseudomonadota bacterium]